MRILLYAGALFVLGTLTAWHLSVNSSAGMNMTYAMLVCSILVASSIGLSVVGEVYNTDERYITHRNLSNRYALLVGLVFISSGLIYQILSHKALDPWLLFSIVAINSTKLLSLIYLNYKK